MNRFEFSQPNLGTDESVVQKEANVKLYDGHEKVEKLKKSNGNLIFLLFQTLFEDGEIILTTHRLFWGKAGEYSRGSSMLQLQLKYVKSLDEEMGSSMFFGKKKRLILHLSEAGRDKLPGPMDFSGASFIKLSGPHGIDDKFIRTLNEVLMVKLWEIVEHTQKSEENLPKIKQRSGIMGIEKHIQAKQKEADANINVAFQDLSKLIKMAKEMVTLSKSISVKIRERQSEASEDETVKFKSALMSLGIDDPVVKDNFQSNTEYLKSLGKEICQTLLDTMTVSIGILLGKLEFFLKILNSSGN